MIDKYKNFNLVHYCIGCNIIGLPEYVTHFIDTRKPPKSYKQNYNGNLPVVSWKTAKTVFKHKHND